MNYKLVFRVLGLILRVEAALMLPATVMAFATGDGDGKAFLFSVLITFLIGQRWLFPHSQVSLPFNNSLIFIYPPRKDN